MQVFEVSGRGVWWVSENGSKFYQTLDQTPTRHLVKKDNVSSVIRCLVKCLVGVWKGSKCHCLSGGVSLGRARPDTQTEIRQKGVKKMTQTNRPRRKKKADRLLNPGSSKDEIMCDYSIAPMDRLALEMDRKWGIDRLPEIVSPETAQRYGVAMAHLNECLESGDPEKCKAAAEGCMRGLQFMDAEATANGKPQAAGEFWEYELKEGEQPFRFAVMADPYEWQASKAQRPDLQFFTMREVALALREYAKSKMVTEAQKHFPQAEIVNIKTRPPVDYANGGDDLNF